MTTTGFRVTAPARPSPREISAVVRGAMAGGLNIGGSVTLTASQATTTVTDARASGSSRIMLFPTTANAAAEFGAGTFHVSSKAKGSFVLAHANNAQADRTFDYILIG